MIKVEIHNGQGLYYQSEVSIINCFSAEGMRGILPDHLPIFVVLVPAVLELGEKERKHFAISGGFLYFKDNHALILSEDVIAVDELNIEELEKELDGLAECDSAKRQILENRLKARRKYAS